MDKKERIESLLYSHRIALLSKIIWKNAEKDWQYWLKKSGITINEYLILATIYAYERATITEISKPGVIHVSTAFNFSKRLEQQNLLKFEKDSNDKRNTYLSLTEKGKNVVEDVFDQYEEDNNSIFKAFETLKEEISHLPHFSDAHYLVSKLQGREFLYDLKDCHDKLQKNLLDEE
ncbi:HTH-type transcriptional regulator Hpr [Staphylococcus sp. 11261D007BR]